MKTPDVSKIPESIDCVVVGAGFSGLLRSALLLKEGKSVLLVEKLAKTGGRLSPENRDGFFLGTGFSFGDSSWWKALSDRLGFSVDLVPVQNGHALVHGSRGWVAPEELPDWERYLSRPCTEFPALGHLGIMQRLEEFCRSFANFHETVEHPATSLWTENGQITKVGLGADQSVVPQEVYWSANYKTLLEVLSGPGSPEPGPERVSWLKKFVKSQPQPGVVLEFAHKTVFSEFTETLLIPFSGSDKEERRYLVGSFTSSRDPQIAPHGKALSTWIFPLSELEWSDNHETMKKIRAAKRMLDKTFPGFDASIQFERVLVLDETVAPLNKKKGELHPVMKNLFLSCDWAMPTGATLEGITQGFLN